MDQPLLDTRITGNQIEKWLSEYFQRPVKIKSCKATQIAAGQGFTATILRVCLEYEKDEDSFPKSVVVKTPSAPAIEEMLKKLTMGKELDIEEAMEFSTLGHSTECAAYRVFGKNPPIPLPKVYAATDCRPGHMGAIVMEDLSEKSAIIGDPTCTLSLEQLYEAADAVASWHAWCMTTDTDWQKHFEPADSERRKELYEQWFEMMKNCFQRVKEKYPNVFDKIDLEMAKKQFDMAEFSKTMQKHRSIMSDVIIHGDFYANNLMYETSKDETGKVTVGSKLFSIIDWPMAHLGNGMEDFARLMTQSVDTETRRRHTKDVLRRYYDSLVKKAGIEKVKASFEEILKIYDDHFVIAGMFYVMMLDWLQSLFVSATGEEGERKKQILYDRCHAVYEDFVPLIANQNP
jgi:aminoglycoside phosphotransferase (APT) family kinase protein